MLALTLLAILLAIFAACRLLFAKDTKNLSWIVMIPIAIVLIVTSHTQVPTNNIGIIRAFEKINPNRYYAAGLSLKWPWEIVRPFDLSFGESQLWGDDAVSAITRDGIPVDIALGYFWAAAPGRVLEVKSALPADGVYNQAIDSASRSAVRLVVSRMTLDEILNDRLGFAQLSSVAIMRATEEHFGAQGFGNPGEIVRFGTLSLRSIMIPETVAVARVNEAIASSEARALAGRTALPGDRSVADTVAIQEAQNARVAIDNGNPVTVVMGDAAVAVRVR